MLTVLAFGRNDTVMIDPEAEPAAKANPVGHAPIHSATRKARRGFPGGRALSAGAAVMSARTRRAEAAGRQRRLFASGPSAGGPWTVLRINRLRGVCRGASGHTASAAVTGSVNGEKYPLPPLGLAAIPAATRL